jgi:hypothetical protein
MPLSLKERVSDLAPLPLPWFSSRSEENLPLDLTGRDFLPKKALWAGPLPILGRVAVPEIGQSSPIIGQAIPM